MKKSRYIIVLTIAVIVMIILFIGFAKPYRVSGDCMEPAIMDGRLYFVNSILPYLRQYRIGDIVVFKYDEKIWVSRIVALEKDRIQITEGSVIVNDVPLQDVGIDRNWSNWKYGDYAIDKPFQVPLAHVFVLSDNLAAQHDDSRVFGPVPMESIVGLVW